MGEGVVGRELAFLVRVFHMAFSEIVQVIFLSVQAVHGNPDEDACNESDNSEDTVVPYKKRVGSEGYCCWGE